MVFIRFYLELSARLYLCKLVKRKNKSVIIRLVNDNFLLVMPPICRDNSNTFFEKSFINFMLHLMSRIN